MGTTLREKTALGKRSFDIDLIKTVAIIGVVFIHTCIVGYSNAVGSFDWLASLFWGSITRASVPLFFMCSGALLLDPDRELTVRKLYSKNVLRILAALLFWAMAYKCFHLAMEGNMTVGGLVQAVKQVVLFSHESHLYYLHILLLVYAFLPVTRVFTKNASRRQLRYLLVLWFLLGILYPTVRPFWPFTLLQGIPVQWMMNMTYAAIGYGILGYVLKKRPFATIVPGTAFLVAGFAMVFFGTWAMSSKSGELYQHFLEGMSVGVCVLAVGIFSLCVSAEFRPSERAAAMVAFCAKASFCIFLVHVFFIDCFAALGFTVRILPCAASIPLVVAVNLLCSGMVYVALSHIPVVKKWLI